MSLGQVFADTLSSWFVRPCRSKKCISRNRTSKSLELARRSFTTKSLVTLRRRDDDPHLQFLADGGYMVEAIARLCHPDGIEIGFDAGPEASAEATMVAINAHDAVTLFEATLIFQGRLARVDILKKTGNTFELIEVKAKSVDTSDRTNPFRGT